MRAIIIFFLLFISGSACDPTARLDCREVLAGKWTNWSQTTDTITTHSIGQGYPHLEWTNFVVQRTDSGIFEYGYINDTLVSVSQTFTIPITEFKFLTDTTGFLNTYDLDLESGASKDLDIRQTRFEILSSEKSSNIKMKIIPEHLMKPTNYQIFRSGDTLLMKNKQGVENFYLWQD